MKILQKTAKIVLFILFLAFALRIFALNAESFWTDEAFSVHHASDTSLKEIITDVTQTEAAPPGYYIFLHYWIQLFGDSEFSVRFPSVIFSVLSVFLLFSIAKKLFSVKVAVLASTFMATSMLQVLFAQEARMYSLFTLFSLLATQQFLGLLESESRKNYAKYILMLALSWYVNYITAVLMCLFCIIWKWKKKNLSLFLKANGIVLLLALPLYPIIKIQFVTLNAGFTETLINKHLPSFLAQLGIFFFLLPFLLVLALLFGVLHWKWLHEKTKSLASSDFFFLSTVLVFSSSYLYLTFFPLSLAGIPLFHSPLTHSYFLIRHLFFLAPALYLYFAHKIGALRWKKIALCAALFLLLVNGIAVHEYITATTKPEWKETLQFIEYSTKMPFILLDKGGFSNEFLLNYYAKKQEMHPTLIPLSWSEHRSLRQIDEIQLVSQLKNEKEFWLILARNPRTQEYYLNLLDERYERKATKEFYQIKAYLFVNENYQQKI